MFWVIAAVALFAAALITFMPLLRGKTFWQPAALALLFLVPAGALWIYTSVGTPAAIGQQPRPMQHPAAQNGQGESEIEAMIASLQGRLAQSPDDLDGWMLLARTLKTVQRYPEALDALLKAQSIAPENPDIMVELAETRIFVTQGGQISDESVAMLEHALELNPSHQKGLWLLGIAAAQRDDLEDAIAYWQTLLDKLEPGSTVAQSVQTQIDQARTRLGQPVAETAVATSTAEPEAAAGTTEDGSWLGTRIRVVPSEDARNRMPTGATLFVIIRSPGPAVGPPLGVRRIVDPILPIDMTISDSDSMMAERKISLEKEVQLQARISLSGSPTVASGDWQSAPLVVPLSQTETVELVLDQQIE